MVRWSGAPSLSCNTTILAFHHCLSPPPPEVHGAPGEHFPACSPKGFCADPLEHRRGETSHNVEVRERVDGKGKRMKKCKERDASPRQPPAVGGERGGGSEERGQRGAGAPGAGGGPGEPGKTRRHGRGSPEEMQFPSARLPTDRSESANAFPAALKIHSHPTCGPHVRGEKRENEGFSGVPLHLGSRRWRRRVWKAQGRGQEGDGLPPAPLPTRAASILPAPREGGRRGPPGCVPSHPVPQPRGQHPRGGNRSSLRAGTWS